jgi:hypothetical protein
MKKTTSILLTLIVLILVIVFIVNTRDKVLISNKQNINNQVSATLKNTDETASWKMYTDKNLDFSVKFPTDMRFTPGTAVDSGNGLIWFGDVDISEPHMGVQNTIDFFSFDGGIEQATLAMVSERTKILKVDNIIIDGIQRKRVYWYDTQVSMTTPINYSVYIPLTNSKTLVILAATQFNSKFQDANALNSKIISTITLN